MAAALPGRASVGKAKRGMSQAARAENMVGFLFISPWLIGFLVFELGPILAAVYLSLTSFDLLTPAKFVGLKNYDRMLFHDPLFRQSLGVTAIYSVGSVFLNLVFGIVLALLLNQNIRFLSVYRTIYYLPAVVSGVAVAFMWVWVFNGDAGIVNAALQVVGIKGPNWFFDLTWTLPTFILMSVWGVGGTMVLYLAGLQGVPTTLYEAASLDGAGAWARIWNVTLPMISPVIFFNLIMGIIGSFQVFTSAFVITEGGPANATMFYVLNLYQNAFQDFKMGYASALAMGLFVIILLLTTLAFRLSGRWVYYEGQER